MEPEVVEPEGPDVLVLPGEEEEEDIVTAVVLGMSRGCD
jgi:hypothetical protein